jgi:hypothetical protein
MSRSSTRQVLAGGNYMSMMNVLMQLRKVCNHPDLFEPRPIVSPLQLPPLFLRVPYCIIDTRLLSVAGANSAIALALHGQCHPHKLSALSQSNAIAAAGDICSIVSCANLERIDLGSTASTWTLSEAIEAQIEGLILTPLVARGGLSVSEVLAPRVVIEDDVIASLPRLSAAVAATKSLRLCASVGVDDSLLPRRTTFTGRTITLKRCAGASFEYSALSASAARSSAPDDTCLDDADPDSWFSPAFFSGVTSLLCFGSATFAELELEGNLTVCQQAEVGRLCPSAAQLCGPDVVAAACLTEEGAAAAKFSPAVIKEARALMHANKGAVSASSISVARLPVLHAALWSARRLERQALMRRMQAQNASRCDPSWRAIYGRDLRDAVSLAAVAGFSSRSRGPWRDLEQDEDALSCSPEVAEGSAAASAGPDIGADVSQHESRKGANSLFRRKFDMRDAVSWRRAHAATFPGGFFSTASLARPCEVVEVGALSRYCVYESCVSCYVSQGIHWLSRTLRVSCSITAGFGACSGPGGIAALPLVVVDIYRGIYSPASRAHSACDSTRIARRIFWQRWRCGFGTVGSFPCRRRH